MKHVLPFIVAAILPAAPAAAGFLGVTFGGDVYVLSEVSGTGAAVGPTGWSQLNSMAKNSAGQYISAAAAPSPRLVEVDPMSGAGSVFHIPFLNNIRALAFSPDDELYAAVDIGGVQSHLYFLDLSVPPGDSSIAVFIGQMTFGGVQGMTFAADGTLYGWSVGHGLVTIDPVTAEATDVNLFSDGTSEIQTLAFSPDGALYGVHDSLYTIDTATGEIILVGSGGYSGIRGFEWLPDPCPADLDGDGSVGITDMLALLAAWGTNPGGPPDFDGDGTVGVIDFLSLLASWGRC